MVRYRIVLDRSHRDGDAMIVPVIVYNPWDCGVCQQPNTDRASCWWCSATRGDWLCGCGRRNKKADEECSECGTPKPDDE